jgi:predicted KAP-like P-loop ATPase
LKNSASFLSDTPLDRSAQDFLNRTYFTRNLADQILSFGKPDCLIIGIHGPWGSGKTTCLNFLASELSSKEKPPVIVRFNPWNFSTGDQLILMFFGEIKNSLGRKDRRGDAKKIGTALENIGKALSPLQIIPGASALPNSPEIWRSNSKGNGCQYF